MGSLVVELVPESVEGPLLRGERVAWRRGCLALEGQVHPLVAAVLLRLARLDPLDADAEADQPGGELGEAAQAGGGEGRAVVGADRLREPVLAESRLENPPCVSAVGLVNDEAAQRVPAELVG